MIKRILFLISSFVCLISINNAYSQSSELEGTWIIERVVIERDVDGIYAINTYSMDNEIESFVSCPAKLSINSDIATLEYQDNFVESGEYSVENGVLKIKTPGIILEYSYGIPEYNKIEIKYYTEYLIDGVNRVKESYIFYGNKE